MAAARGSAGSPGFRWAAAVMGTPANVEDLAAAGFDVPAVRANDLVLAVRAASAPQAAAGIDAGDGTLASAATREEPGGPEHRLAMQVPRTVEDAVAALQDANVAIVSVPCPFAALEAHKALSQGLHVLLFSDNVGLDDEVGLQPRRPPP